MNVTVLQSATLLPWFARVFCTFVHFFRAVLRGLRDRSSCRASICEVQGREVRLSDRRPLGRRSSVENSSDACDYYSDVSVQCFVLFVFYMNKCIPPEAFMFSLSLSFQVGTFREFILFDSDQVYPAFILRYKRWSEARWGLPLVFLCWPRSLSRLVAPKSPYIFQHSSGLEDALEV